MMVLRSHPSAYVKKSGISTLIDSLLLIRYPRLKRVIQQSAATYTSRISTQPTIRDADYLIGISSGETALRHRHAPIP